MYEIGKLYETEQGHQSVIGNEFPVIISGVGASITILGSEQKPATLNDMQDIATASSPFTEGVVRFNSFPRYISFAGNGDNIEVGNCRLVDSGSIGYPELNTSPSAVSDPNGNEIDGIGDFTPQGGIIFISQSVVKNTGLFTIEANSNISGVNGSRFYVDLDASPFNCVIGNKYEISFNSRHVGSGGEWRYLLDPVNTLAVGTILKSLLNTDIVFTETKLIFTHSLNTKYFGAREFSALSDGGVYLDNFSLKQST